MNNQARQTKNVEDHYINKQVFLLFCWTTLSTLPFELAELKEIRTRKSSCVNARGIPTAPYLVLYLLPKVGYPPPGRGTPLARCDWGGVPEVGYPPLGYPRPGVTGGGWGYLRWGTPPRAGPGWGTPRLDLAGVPPPPPPRCEQTENITFAHPSDAVGNDTARILCAHITPHATCPSLRLSRENNPFCSKV